MSLLLGVTNHAISILSVIKWNLVGEMLSSLQLHYKIKNQVRSKLSLLGEVIPPIHVVAVYLFLIFVVDIFQKQGVTVVHYFDIVLSLLMQTQGIAMEPAGTFLLSHS